jgi:hypothetical protein
LRLLALEGEREAATVTGPGRDLHRSWVAEVFGEATQGSEAMLDMLVVVTDVYAWKLLRLDRGLDASVVRERMGDMVTAILRSATS